MIIQRMKIKRVILWVLILQSSTLWAQSRYCKTYTYEGVIQAGQKQLGINLHFLVLLDSTLIGAYHYNPAAGALKLAGKLHPDFTFVLNERNEQDSITGFFKGRLDPDFKAAQGTWTNVQGDRVFKFNINRVKGKSFYDDLDRYRALPEYTNVEQAMRAGTAVKAIQLDLGNQELTTLPEGVLQCDNVVALSLLANRIRQFPPGLKSLESLEELSLSSNELTAIGPEIGELQHLRILYLNFNKIVKIPKEIGALKQLLYLDLGDNKLTTLPAEIGLLTNLQELYLNRNNLGEAEKQRIRKLLPGCVIHF